MVYEQGVPITGTADPSKVAAATAAVKAADVTVMVLGNAKGQEHEGIDRKDTLLQPCQESFASSVFVAAGGKPVIVVLSMGGAISIDDLIPKAGAIIGMRPSSASSAAPPPPAALAPRSAAADCLPSPSTARRLQPRAAGPQGAGRADARHGEQVGQDADHAV